MKIGLRLVHLTTGFSRQTCGRRPADAMDKSGDMSSYVNDSFSSVRFGSFAVADHSVKLDGERESPRRTASGPEWLPRRLWSARNGNKHQMESPTSRLLARNSFRLARHPAKITHPHECGAEPSQPAQSLTQNSLCYIYNTIAMTVPISPTAPWLLLVFSLPAKSASQRVEIWRKLQRYGTLLSAALATFFPIRP